MAHLYHRAQLGLPIKRAICAHHVANPHLRHVDLSRWCFTRFGIRPDRSTIGRVLKGADRWVRPDGADDVVRVRGGAHPELERAMARWIANAGPACVPLTLATIRDHVARMLFTHYIEQLDATMFAEGRKIVVLLDNASSHTLTTEGATMEDMFGFRTVALGNVRLVYLPPNTTCFTQPLDQGLISMAKAHYRQHWLRAFTGMWCTDGATTAAARFKPNLRLVLEWLSDAWMNIGPRAIQRYWWRTGCLPHVWALSLPHVGDNNGNNGPNGAVAGRGNAADIGLDQEVNDVGLLIDRLCLGPSAMAAADFVHIDANQPNCAEPGEDPLAREPESAATAAMWEAPTNMQAVYDDCNPTSREARRTARAACEMLIGYARATCISPPDLCALFDIRNPIIVARMEWASPSLDLNHAPPPAVSHADTPPLETPRRRGRVLPAWMHVPTPDWVAQSARRQELIDAGAPAVMSGYLAAAEWMPL
ncbi:unnamed protein product [Closterium sp. NIES-64]|nr:unnamed protein product [Closterium sp. NIES-64]CAI5992237.1 unnamed protein product [Closterium sp. NIES-65]